MKKITVVLADDHPIVRTGVRSILQSQPDFTVVGEAGDGEEALRLIAKLKPQMLLLDLSMPKLPGIETLRELTARSSRTTTVLLTGSVDKERVLEALQLGAKGIVLKEAVALDLTKCLRAVNEGKYWLDGKPVSNLVQVIKDLVATTAPVLQPTSGLTPRELEIVALIVQGGTNKDIAAKCGISEETVKRHLQNVFEKLGVTSRLELAMYAVNHHLAEK